LRNSRHVDATITTWEHVKNTVTPPKNVDFPPQCAAMTRTTHRWPCEAIGRICVHAKARRAILHFKSCSFFHRFSTMAAAPAQLPIARALWIRSICRVYPFKYRRARRRFIPRFCDTKRDFLQPRAIVFMRTWRKSETAI